MKDITKKTLDMMLNRYGKISLIDPYQRKWSYDLGVILKGMERAYQVFDDSAYFEYIKKTIDEYILEDGSIKFYDLEDYNIDYINNGKLLYFLYDHTKQEKYKNAMDLLYNQINNMPRTAQGGFWHKKIYPNQMWLDGLYMAAPFYCEYTKRYENGKHYDDVVRQFILCFENMQDQETGLLFHAWDTSKEQFWCDKETGLSKNIWGRSMGWYVLALIDTIEILPDDYETKNRLVNIFNELIQALYQVRDNDSNVWHQVLNKKDQHGNYLEASASCMIVAASLKALNQQYLYTVCENEVLTSFEGVMKEFVIETEEGWVNLIRNCQVAGLGGKERRDGSFAYYISEPIVTNDFKGLGAFIQMLVEAENLAK